MLQTGSRRHFLQRHLPSIAVLVGGAGSALTMLFHHADRRRDPARPADPTAAGDGFVLLDGWILRRSDLDLFK